MWGGPAIGRAETEQQASKGQRSARGTLKLLIHLHYKDWTRVFHHAVNCSSVAPRRKRSAEEIRRECIPRSLQDVERQNRPKLRKKLPPPACSLRYRSSLPPTHTRVPDGRQSTGVTRWQVQLSRRRTRRWDPTIITRVEPRYPNRVRAV